MTDNQQPLLITEESKENKNPSKSFKTKKVNFNKFIEFDWKKSKEKIRFGITYLFIGLIFIFISDVFQLIKLNTTAGFMVFLGVIFIIAAIITPIILIAKEFDENERKRRETRW